MSEQNNDPLNFVRNLWGQMGFSLPGMVTPTLDTEEIGKQVADLKAVEGWLKMNLSMLQMTIQNLEMQQATLNAVRAMGEMASKTTGAAPGEAPAGAGASMQDSLAQAAMWPWQMMQDMQAHMQAAAERAAAAAPAAPKTPKTARASEATESSRKPAARKPASKKAS